MAGGRGGSRRAVAIAASLALHAALLVVLAGRLGGPSPAAEAPAMQVTLAPWPAARREPTPGKRPKPKRRTPIVPHVAQAPNAVERAPPPVAIPPAQASRADPGRAVLRGLLACRNADLLRLPPEEREKCQELAGALAAGAAGPRLRLDKGFVRDGDLDPALIRKPVDGCRVRAAGDKPGPTGEQKGFTAGVGCSWRF